MVRVWGGWVGTGQDVALDFDTTVKAKQVKSEEEDDGQGQEGGQ